MRSCEKCGALISTENWEQKLEAIPGLEYAKRAAEVAAAGGHSITLVTSHYEVQFAVGLAAWATDAGATARVAHPCPCGNYAHPERLCRCEPEEIRAWRAHNRYRAAIGADIVISVRPPRLEQILSDRPRESGQVVLARVQAARQAPAPATELDTTSRHLLRAAGREGYLPGQRAYQVRAVAATIARLGGADRVEAAHLAEALQYCPGPRPGLLS